MRHLAGDERQAALDQIEESRVRRRIGIVDIIVERDPRVGDNIERRAVGKGDATRRVGGGLHYVALVDGVADVERDGNAVTDDGDFADDLLDAADRLGRRDLAGLRVLVRRRRSGQEPDEIGR